MSAAPVGDDAELVRRLRDVAQLLLVRFGPQSPAVATCGSAADRLAAQATRIAELERENVTLRDDLATANRGGQLVWNDANSYRQVAEQAERQLAAAQDAITLLLERVEDIGCVNCHHQHRTANPDGKPPCVACAEAIATARRALDEATKWACS